MLSRDSLGWVFYRILGTRGPNGGDAGLEIEIGVERSYLTNLKNNVSTSLHSISMGYSFPSLLWNWPIVVSLR